MAELALVCNPSLTYADGVAVVLDATVNEVWRTSAAVTSHPVEDGVEISDHIRDEPDELELEGSISGAVGDPGAEWVVAETPAPAALAMDLGVAPYQAGQRRVEAKLIDAGLTLSETRAEDEFELLVGIKEAKQTITVYTGTRAYEDMVITSIQRTRNAAAGSSVEVSISLRKVRKAYSRTVDAPQRPSSVQGAKKDIGKKPKKEATPETAQRVSILQQLFGGA